MVSCTLPVSCAAAVAGNSVFVTGSTLTHAPYTVSVTLNSTDSTLNVLDTTAAVSPAFIEVQTFFSYVAPPAAPQLPPDDDEPPLAPPPPPPPPDEAATVVHEPVASVR